MFISRRKIIFPALVFCITLFAAFLITAMQHNAPAQAALAATPMVTANVTATQTATNAFTETPHPTKTPYPTPTPFVLTNAHPSDMDLLRVLFNSYQPEYFAEYFNTVLANNENLIYERQDIDINGDGQTEALINGRVDLFEFGYVGILGIHNGQWKTLGYLDASGHYCINADATAQADKVIVDFLYCYGGTGVFDQTWEQHWLKCSATECHQVFETQPLAWSRSVNPNMENNYKVARVTQPDPNTIIVNRERYAVQGIALATESNYGVEPQDARRIVGPNERETYKWNGDKFQLVKQEQTLVGTEIHREFDNTTLPTTLAIRELMAKPFYYREGAGISFDNDGFNKEADVFWGISSEVPNSDFTSRGWVEPQAAAQDTQGKQRIAAVIGGESKTICRLNIQHVVSDTLQLVARQDLPCIPNFTRIFWQDIDNDKQDELLFLTMPNLQNDEPGFQNLRIFRVTDRLTEIAHIQGEINGTDGVGIKRENKPNGFYVYTGIAPSNYNCVAFDCISFDRRWKTFHWDAKTEQLVQEKTP